MTEAVAPDPSVDISATLIALRDILGSVPGIDRKALNRLDEAKDEAEKPEPKREEVKKLISEATGYASSAAGFAAAVECLTPHLQRAAAWLGSTWQSWAPTLGLG